MTKPLLHLGEITDGQEDTVADPRPLFRSSDSLRDFCVQLELIADIDVPPEQAESAEDERILRENRRKILTLLEDSEEHQGLLLGLVRTIEKTLMALQIIDPQRKTTGARIAGLMVRGIFEAGRNFRTNEVTGEELEAIENATGLTGVLSGRHGIGTFFAFLNRQILPGDIPTQLAFDAKAEQNRENVCALLTHISLKAMLALKAIEAQASPLVDREYDAERVRLLDLIMRPTK